MKIRVIAFSFLVILLIVILIVTKNEEFEIGNNRRIICGNIESVVYSRGGYLMKYTFSVGGEKIYGQAGCSKETKMRFDSGINRVPVIFNPEKPKTNRILENDESYAKFNIQKEDIVNLHCQ